MKDVRPDLVHNGIFQVSKDVKEEARPDPTFVSDGKAVVVPADIHIEGYGLDGRTTHIEADMVAKRQTVGDATTFWARFSTVGGDGGKILNPRGMYFSVDDFKSKKQKRGGTRYVFRQIDSQPFILYVSFLNSHLEGVLREAERMISNG